MSGQYFAKSDHSDVVKLLTKKRKSQEKKGRKETPQQSLCRKQWDEFVGRLKK